MAADRSQALPATIADLLVDVRKRIRFRILVDGLLVALIIALTIYWMGAAFDYLPVRLGSNETPNWLRMSLLCLMAGLVAWAILWRMGSRYFARLTDRNLAVLLERHFPQLNNELVTVVELASRPEADVSNPVAYRAMLARVQQAASASITKIDTGRLLNWRPVHGFALLASLLIAWTIAVAIVSPQWMSQWNARFFSLSDRAWPRMAELAIEGVQFQLPNFTGQLSAQRVMIPFSDKTAHVPRGSAVTLNAKANADAKLVPELCTLFYQVSDGSRGRANMRRLGAASSGWQAFMLDGPPLVDLTSDVSFDIVGGDARLDDYSLQVIDPAVIKTVQLQLTYPPYLLASRTNLPPSETLEFRTGLRIPEGTQVTLKGSASGPLKTVQYVVRQSSDRRQSPSKEESARGSIAGDVDVRFCEPRGKEFEIPLGLLTETTIIEIRLLDEFGLTGDQIPRYVLPVAEDTLPEIEAKLVGIGTAVTPKAILPLSGKATDDHGLARTWATVVVGEQSPVELDVPVDTAGKFEPKIDLEKLATEGQLRIGPNATLGLALSAADRYDLAGMKHVGNGQPIQLAVVDQEKLLIMLDRQELELRQRLEQIIGELGQLRDVLTEQANLKLLTTQRKQIALSSFVSSSQQTEVQVAPASGGAADKPSSQDNQEDATAKDPEQQRKLMLLRAQQSVVQGDKSNQELVGLAGLVNDIRLQLINNRILDSIDRQQRLNEKVYEPLQRAIAGEMQSLRSRLTQFQTSAMSPSGGPEQAALAVHENERVLAALNEIVANMLELAGYNEVMAELRGFRDQQEELLKETQKQRAADLLKLQ